MANPWKDTNGDLVVSRRDSSSHINIFFVWQLELGEKRDRALGAALGRDALIEDWDGEMDRNNDKVQDDSPAFENARALAHEIGHILGIDDATKTRKIRNHTTRHPEEVSVNAHYVLGSGPFIPKQHANIMNAIAKQIVGR